MSCRKIEKLLPLYAGGDLPEKQMARVRAHIASCVSCEREAGDLRRALDAARALARSDEAGDWAEAEWTALMRSITSAKPAQARSFARSSLRPVAAVALGLLIVCAGALLLFRRTAGPAGPLQTALKPATSEIVGHPAGPEKPPPTILRVVIKDGQVKLVWPFDSNFNFSRYGK